MDFLPTPFDLHCVNSIYQLLLQTVSDLLTRKGIPHSWKPIVTMFFLKVLFYLKYKEQQSFTRVLLFQEKLLVGRNQRTTEPAGGISFPGQASFWLIFWDCFSFVLRIYWGIFSHIFRLEIFYCATASLKHYIN